MTTSETSTVISATAAVNSSARPVAPSQGALRPLGLSEVAITGGFWGERQHTNSVATLTHINGFLESEGWLTNFDLATSGGLPEGRRGREFSDSEVYKYLEAVAWEIGRQDNSALEVAFRAVTARVAAAQETDGYIHTHFGRPGQQPRWSDLEWGHELYCMGHLFQAAVARERTRPAADDGLLTIARRAADMVCDTFGPDRLASVCGHAEIEMGLAELGRVTGEQRYIDQASLFVDRRGTGVLADIEWGSEYFQDDQPLREADVLRGHAVRANYLAAGAVDVAIERSDEGLLAALEKQWAATATRRTYLTGGQGSRHQDEGFGDDWALPSDRAYSETCAGIASVMFSWRLLLARGDAMYGDLIERTLYNVVATSPSDDGTAFFYANTLHQRKLGAVADANTVSKRALSPLRAPWFEVSCCPPNVARTLASLAAYVATASDDGIQIHQYAPSTITTEIPAGTVALTVETNYPHAGTVRVRVDSAPAEAWELALRIPSWAEDGTLAGPRGMALEAEPGYARIRRVFLPGDEIVLELPVEPRLTWPNTRIDAVRGCVAVERGPLVYCVESTDLEDAGLCAVDDDLTLLRIDPDHHLRDQDGTIVAQMTLVRDPDEAWPYGSAADETVASPLREVRLVPYHSWGNRGPSTMRVWIPASDD
jgi:hypothetical protein